MGLLDEAIREHLELKRRRGADPTEIDRLEREALGPVRRVPQEGPDVLIDQDSPQALLDHESPAGDAYPIEEEVPYDMDEAAEWADAPPEPPEFDHRPPESSHWEEAEPPTQIAPLPGAGVEPQVPDRPSELPKHHEIAEEWEAHERQSTASDSAKFGSDEPGLAPLESEGGTPPPVGEPSPEFRGEPGPVAPESYDFEQETMEHDVEAEELQPAPDAEPQKGDDMLEETPDFLQDTPDHDRLWFEQRPPRDFDFDG